MILFKAHFIDDILAGRKTQTRRTGKKRWNVGATHELKTGYMGKPFAKAQILEVRSEQLGHISEADAIAEGFNSRDEFFREFKRIHKMQGLQFATALTRDVWVVRFELAATEQPQ